jgi:pseudouridine kinase
MPCGMITLLAFGGAHIDRIARTNAPARMGTSNPAGMASRAGGVARNVVETVTRLGCQARLVTRLGQDGDADVVRASLPSGVIVSLPSHPGIATAGYTAVLDSSGELIIGLADMAAYDTITPDEALSMLVPARLLLVDANLAADTIAALVRAGHAQGSLVAAVGVSVEKVQRLSGIVADLDFLFINHAESAVLKTLSPTTLITSGADGVRLTGSGRDRQFAAVPATIMDVNGAGDGFAGGVLAATAMGLDLDSAIGVGLRVAARAVSNAAAVDPTLQWKDVAP